MIPNVHATCNQPSTFLEHALTYARRGMACIPVIDKNTSPRNEVEAFPEQASRRMHLAPTLCPPQNHRPGRPARFSKRRNGGPRFRHHGDLQPVGRIAPTARRTLPTVETHRGRHVYFRGPEDFRKVENGEYRGRPGCYCVLPPSRHPTGSIYRWLIPLPNGDLPELDPFQAGLLPHQNTPCNGEDRRAQRTERRRGQRERRGQRRQQRTGESAEDTEDGESAEDGDNTAPPQCLPSSLSSPFSLLQASEQAISATLPTMPGQRNRCIFQLARHFKSISSLHSAAPGKLRPIVQEWHRRALPTIGTKPFLDTWADFLRLEEGQGPR